MSVKAGVKGEVLAKARACAAAIPGCQHVLGGLPCQDAVQSLVTEDRVILAVSDGHGDAQYTHSDEGARIAVGVAIDVLSLIVDHIGGSGRPQTPADRMLEAPASSSRDVMLRNAPTEREMNELVTPLKRRIAFEWNRRVKHHARMVAARDGLALLWPDEVTGDWDEKVKVYGCTLVAVAITNDAAIWLRLGDGEALAVHDRVARRIFSAADKSMGQATYSLSMRTCIEHIEVVIEHASPKLVVLATDGVADQYDVDPSFEDEWGVKILDRIATKGFTVAMMDLPRHLGTVARDGDDCSVAMAWFPNADQDPPTDRDPDPNPSDKPDEPDEPDEPR